MVVPYLLQLQVLRRELARVYYRSVLVKYGCHGLILEWIVLWQLVRRLHAHAAVVFKLRLYFLALLICVALAHHLAAQRGHSLELLDLVHFGEFTAAEMVHQFLIYNVWSWHDVLEDVLRPVCLELLLRLRIHLVLHPSQGR